MIWSRLAVRWWLEGPNNRSHIGSRMRAGREKFRVQHDYSKLLHVVFLHPRHFYTLCQERKKKNYLCCYDKFLAASDRCCCQRCWGVNNTPENFRPTKPNYIKFGRCKSQKVSKNIEEKHPTPPPKTLQVPACVAGEKKSAAETKTIYNIAAIAKVP